MRGRRIDSRDDAVRPQTFGDGDDFRGRRIAVEQHKRRAAVETREKQRDEADAVADARHETRAIGQRERIERGGHFGSVVLEIAECPCETFGQSVDCSTLRLVTRHPSERITNRAVHR